MANYRYKTAEIEAMKKDILTHCEYETSPDRNGNKSAWRLRLILEGMAMCCRCSQREEARRYRKLALFERLTTNDMPNWLTEPTQPATPAETPQISTETAEATNVSAESEKREETAKYRIFRYRSDNFEKVTIGDKSQCRVICILSTFKGKSYIEIGNTTIGVGTGGQQLIEVSRSITDMSDAELIDIMLNTKVSHNIYEDKIYPYSYFVNEDTPQPPKNAPQSRKAAPAANYATPIPKAREIARKRHCRSLGANGYAMLDDAAATLAAINTPQRLTANAPPIGRPQLTPYW